MTGLPSRLLHDAMIDRHWLRGVQDTMGQRKVRLGRVTDVDLRLLRIFQTVVNCGGLSAAEIDLGIGRSTVSTHIAELEARLGTRLCQRGRSGFSLTSDGKKILRGVAQPHEVPGRLP